MRVTRGKPGIFNASVLLALAATFVFNGGSAAAEDSGRLHDDTAAAGGALPGGVVLGVAPEWPFQGFFVAHLGRYWDTGRGQVHDTGPHLDQRGYMPCLHEYFVVAEDAVRVGYRGHGSTPWFGYVIPWGDVAYPVIDGRDMPTGPFDASSRSEEGPEVAAPGPTPELWADPRVAVTHAYSADYAVGAYSIDDAGERHDATDLRLPADWDYDVGWSLAAFRLTNEPEREGVGSFSSPFAWEHPRYAHDANTGRWYLNQHKVRGFVETSTVEAGEMDPEDVLAAVTDDSGRADGDYRPSIDGTDGRYYGLTMWRYRESNCSYDYRSLVVDGVSGEVVGCLETPRTEIGSGLVFVAAPQAARLERFELPSAPVPVGLDACRYRLDGPELDGFPFVDTDSRGSGE